MRSFQVKKLINNDNMGKTVVLVSNHIKYFKGVITLCMMIGHSVSHFI